MVNGDSGVCGSDVVVIGKNLRRGIAKSCGCLQKERTSQASFKDLRGFVFGRLTVLGRDKNVGKTKMWRCRCDCGQYHTVAGCNLIKGDVRSCGCFCRDIGSSKLIDMKGQVFERLRVIRRALNDAFDNTMWICRCLCGAEVIVSRDNLVQKRVKSCGCLNAERIAVIGRARQRI